MVEYHRFVAPVLGIYVADSTLPVIGLHALLHTHHRLLRCVLAEELGHHFTGAVHGVATPYLSHLGRVLLTRAEKRALRWAAQFLMPPLEVVKELRESAGVEDLADEFYVTPTFVRALAQLPMYMTAVCGTPASFGVREA